MSRFVKVHFARFVLMSQRIVDCGSVLDRFISDSGKTATAATIATITITALLPLSYLSYFMSNSPNLKSRLDRTKSRNIAPGTVQAAFLLFGSAP